MDVFFDKRRELPKPDNMEASDDDQPEGGVNFDTKTFSVSILKTLEADDWNFIIDPSMTRDINAELYYKGLQERLAENSCKLPLPEECKPKRGRKKKQHSSYFS